MIALCDACSSAHGQTEFDLRRTHANSIAIEITIAVKQASSYGPGVPELYSVNRIAGQCHSAQKAPLKSAARRKPSHLVNSGTQNPRHPISSPVAEMRLSRVPTVAIATKAASASTAFDCPCMWNRSAIVCIYSGFGIPPIPVIQTATYATVAYAIGTSHPTNRYFTFPGFHPISR